MKPKLNSYQLKKDKNESIIDFIMLALIFMLSMNFLNRHYFFVFAAFALVLFRKKIQLPRHIVSITLLVFAIMWQFFSAERFSGITTFIKPLSFFFCFVVGYNFVKDLSKEKANRRIATIIIVIACGSFGHFCLNYIMSIGSLGRNTVDFWMRTTLAATNQAALADYMVALSCACLFSNVKLRYKLLSLLSIVIVMLYNLILSGRSLIVMLAVCLAVSLIYMLSENKIKRTGVKTVVIFAICILILLCLVLNNAFGLQDMFMESNWYNRFFGKEEYGLNTDARGMVKIKYLSLLLDYPFGGGKIREALGGSYAHDLILDCYSEAGPLAAVALLIFMISGLKEVFVYLKKSEAKFFAKQMVLCTFAVSILQFCIEPILFGYQWMFASYAIIVGSIYAGNDIER